MDTMMVEVWMMKHPPTMAKLIFTYGYFLASGLLAWWLTKKFNEEKERGRK